HILDAGEGEGLGAHLPAQLRPAENGDDADDEGDENTRGCRNGDQRREGEIERQLREGEDQFDEALDPDIEAAAEIARRDTDTGADDGGETDHDQRDRQRDLRSDDAAGENVAAELVGAEEVYGPPVGRTEEVDGA